MHFTLFWTNYFHSLLPVTQCSVTFVPMKHTGDPSDNSILSAFLTMEIRKFCKEGFSMSTLKVQTLLSFQQCSHLSLKVLPLLYRYKRVLDPIFNGFTWIRLTYTFTEWYFLKGYLAYMYVRTWANFETTLRVVNLIIHYLNHCPCTHQSFYKAFTLPVCTGVRTDANRQYDLIVYTFLPPPWTYTWNEFYSYGFILQAH